MVKIMDSKPLFNRIYHILKHLKKFRCGGQKSHMEAKMLLAYKSKKMFLFTIYPSFRTILAALNRGLFPIYHITSEKKYPKNHYKL